LGEKYVSKGYWFVLLLRGSGPVACVSEILVASIFRTEVSEIHSSDPWEEEGCCPLQWENGHQAVKVIFEGLHLPLNPDGFIL
jgi:hypothetical protein